MRFPSSNVTASFYSKNREFAGRHSPDCFSNQLTPCSISSQCRYGDISLSFQKKPSRKEFIARAGNGRRPSTRKDTIEEQLRVRMLAKIALGILPRIEWLEVLAIVSKNRGV